MEPLMGLSGKGESSQTIISKHLRARWSEWNENACEVDGTTKVVPCDANADAEI